MFRNQSFHIIRFLVVFTVLTVGFYGYIGVISPGGEGYSPVLDHYANFPAWLTFFICKCAKGILEMGGYTVVQKSLNSLAISGSRGVNIIWACLGFGVMSFWVAFVTAHKASPSYKFKWVAIGVCLITGINIIRIALIAVANHYNWKAFNAVEPHFAFNVVSYIAIILIAVIFARKYNKYKESKMKLKKQQHQFRRGDTVKY